MNLKKYILFDSNIINHLIMLVTFSFFLPTLVVTPILLVITLVIFIFRSKSSKLNYRKIDSYYKLFFLYFLTIVISLIFSNDFKNGLEELFNYISFIFVPIVFIYIRHERIDFNFLTKRYVNFLLIVFLLLLIVAIYRNIIDGYSFEYVLKRVFGIELTKNKYDYFNYWYFVYDKFCEPLKIQPIYLGLFTNIGLAFLYLNYSISKSKYLFIKIILLFILLALIASRSQLVIGILNFLLFLFIYAKPINYKTKIISVIATLSIVGLVSFSNPIIKMRIVEALTYKEAFYEDSFGGTSIRIRKWHNAITLIEESPVFGYGIGDYKEELLNQYKIDKFYLGYYKKFNSHNQYLDTGIAIGLFGVLILTLIFFYSYFYSKNNIFLFFIANIYFISFFTESMFSRQWGVISFPFFLCLAFHYGLHSVKFDKNCFK